MFDKTKVVRPVVNTRFQRPAPPPPIGGLLPKSMLEAGKNTISEGGIVGHGPLKKEDLREEVYRRLEIGADGTALFLPHVGEFGHRILTGIRLVHFNKARTKIVCCRPGEEVLYPAAARFYTDWPDPVDDKLRAGTGEPYRWPQIEKLFPFPIVHTGALDMDQEKETLYPEYRMRFRPIKRGLSADICFGVRHREFCPEKNWPIANWGRIGLALNKAGFTFGVVGLKPATLDIPGQACSSGDYDTDAAIEMLQGCQLYLGTDTGVSHLCATIGKPMIVWREESAWNRDLRDCMVQRNFPGMTKLMPPETWKHPEWIIETALSFLANRTFAL